MVEVVYIAHDQTTYEYKVDLPESATILDAIQKSGVMLACPEIDLNRQKIGVYSKRRVLTDRVQEGDRVEIYRPLLIDPKEARRQKAKK